MKWQAFYNPTVDWPVLWVSNAPLSPTWNYQTVQLLLSLWRYNHTTTGFVCATLWEPEREPERELIFGAREFYWPDVATLLNNRAPCNVVLDCVLEQPDCDQKLAAAINLIDWAWENNH